MLVHILHHPLLDYLGRRRPVLTHYGAQPRQAILLAGQILCFRNAIRVQHYPIAQLHTRHRSRKPSNSLKRLSLKWRMAFLLPWRTSLDRPQQPRTYGQVRGVMPFSCAYFATDASTRGRTSVWSVAIQSVIACHCVPFHCWNFTPPLPS
jgi:hypothetical protein